MASGILKDARAEEEESVKDEAEEVNEELEKDDEDSAGAESEKDDKHDDEVEDKEVDEEKEDMEVEEGDNAKDGESMPLSEDEETPVGPEKKGRSKQREKQDAVTPFSDRPARERKVVERFSVPDAVRPSGSKPLSIEKGSGTPLKDIPNVAFRLSKRKADDDLQMLHTILFGKKGKLNMVKRNIGQFSGYVWADNEEKQRAKVLEKLERCNKERLLNFCEILNISRNKSVLKKEELTTKILEFLESPHVTTEVLLAETKKNPKKRKSSASKGVVSDEKSVKRKVKRLEDKEKLQVNDSDSEDRDTDHVGPAETKKGSQEDESSNEGSERVDREADEEGAASKEDFEGATSRKTKESLQKKGSEKSKKTHVQSIKSPSMSNKKVSASSSRRKTSDGNDLDTKRKEKPTKEKVSSRRKLPEKPTVKTPGKAKSVKKSKSEPSMEEIHAVIVDILKEVDFNTATLSDILKQLSKHFGIDLMHKKTEVKEIITEVINNMSDEEEDGEEADDNDDDE